MNFISMIASIMLLIGAAVLGASIMKLKALFSRLPEEISVERSEQIKKIFAMIYELDKLDDIGKLMKLMVFKKKK